MEKVVETKKRAKVSELKEMIVYLKLEVINLTVPNGHCPFSYYNMGEAVKTGCELDMSCNECKSYFLDEMRKIVEKEVKAL